MPELLASCSSEELTEWMAYEKLTGPIGAERADLLHGVRTAVLANINRAKGKPAFKPGDFIPRWSRPPEQDWTQMLNAVRAMNRQFGGTDLTEGSAER